MKLTPKQNPLVYLCRDGQRQRGLPTAVRYEEHQARDHRNAKALVGDNEIAVLQAQIAADQEIAVAAIAAAIRRTARPTVDPIQPL